MCYKGMRSSLYLTMDETTMKKCKCCFISVCAFLLFMQMPLVSQAQQAPLTPVLDALDLKSMDILDVAKLISQKTGVNIVVGKNVKGRVTIFLRDTEMEDALRIIVEANGWAMAKDSDVIKIMTAADFEERYGYKFGRDIKTKLHRMVYMSSKDAVEVLNQVKSSEGKILADEKSNMLILKDDPHKIEEMEEILAGMDVPVDTQVFQLNYANGEELVDKINELLTPDTGAVQFDERSKKIIVSDSPYRMQRVRHFIEAFDEQHKEVFIEAKIVQITLTDDHKLGIDWEGLVSDFHSLTLKSNFDVLGATEKRGELSFGTLADDDYTVLLQALNEVGETEILSSPRIAAVSEKEAKILVGSEEPYVTTTTTTPSSGPTTTAESVTFIDVGVKLFVTPVVHDDGFITMNIRPEVSSVVKTIVTGNNNTIPVVETSEAETTVMIKDQVTVVIGGLIKNESIETAKQVPWLGKIPILGLPFRSHTRDETKTEIAIFLTPRIITGDTDDKNGF